MKNLLSFDEFVNEQYLYELRTAINSDALKIAEKDKKQIQVVWNDGNLIAQPTMNPEELKLMGFKPTSLMIDYKNKTVRASFMDDWSDFKFIKRVQQMIKDLIRLDAITKKWKISISGDKATKIKVQTWISKNNIRGTFHSCC
jgi:hypothetical protein